MTSPKHDAAPPEGSRPFPGPAPAPSPLPGPALPDNEVTQVMAPPPKGSPNPFGLPMLGDHGLPPPASARPGPTLPPIAPPPLAPDNEITQVMPPAPMGPAGSRSPLSLPPRPGLGTPPAPSAWPPLPPGPAPGFVASGPAPFVDEATRVMPPAPFPAAPPHMPPAAATPSPLMSPYTMPAAGSPGAPSHPATAYPRTQMRSDGRPDTRPDLRQDPGFGPDLGPRLDAGRPSGLGAFDDGGGPPAIAPTIAVAGYEPTMVIKGGQERPRTMTLPDLSRGKAATLPGSLSQPIDGNVQQVGRYLIRERLGRGGMATVFKAHDPTLNRDVAIKFLHASLCADEEYRARFLTEARAAGGLSHPNIVVVHDVGEIDGRPYMAMELIDGGSLADELEHHKPMPIRDVVVMGMQLARALDYAHTKGIVHRDIKPGNIMRLSGTHTVKVMDFGIAHVDDNLDKAQHTRVGDVLGTPQYMSPEQANGEKLDGRSDLFSAGIVLYQMLTGKRPFRGDTLVAVATRIATEDPTPINKQRAEVPASLRRVIDRCLAKQPANRFQTGRELSEALSKVLAEMDEAALAKNRPRIVPLRVRWAATMALIVAVVMGLTTAVITQRQYAAMMSQVSDYGASLARFIAKQNAAQVLGEDWTAVEVSVQEVMKTGDFERVTLIDTSGVVRVSSQAALVGQPYKAEGVEVLSTKSGASATRYLVGGEPVLGFEAPVTFQDKLIGRVALGIPERPLTQVARLSISLMVVLAVVTVLAVAIAMYFVANWFAKPIQLVADSMAEIGKGRFDHRINEQRKDEFGQLYAAFDGMAQALQDRSTAGIDTPLPPTMVPRHNAPETQRRPAG